MGAITAGEVLGGALMGVSSLLGMDSQNKAMKEQAAAQQRALEQQRQAQQEQLALQEQQAAKNDALRQQQINQSQKEITNAAAAISNTPKVTNQANLTGGQGVDPSSLNLGGSSTLGSLDDLLGDYL